MSSEWELDDGIKAIKSAWRREHTARRNLEKMLENAEAENAKLRELLAEDNEELAKMRRAIDYLYSFAKACGVDAEDMRELGVEVDA